MMPNAYISHKITVGCQNFKLGCVAQCTLFVFFLLNVNFCLQRFNIMKNQNTKNSDTFWKYKHWDGAFLSAFGVWHPTTPFYTASRIGNILSAFMKEFNCNRRKIMLKHNCWHFSWISLPHHDFNFICQISLSSSTTTIQSPTRILETLMPEFTTIPEKSPTTEPFIY